MKTKQTNKLRKKDHKELPPTQSLASRSATTLNSRGITKKETLQSRCMKSRILRIMSIYIFMLTRHLDNNTGKIHTPRGSPWKPHQPPPNRVSNNTPNPLIPTPVYINLHTHIWGTWFKDHHIVPKPPNPPNRKYKTQGFWAIDQVTKP